MSELNKKPKIRFKEFTDDWEQHKLKEFGVTTAGTSIETEFSEDGKYKVVSIGSYSEQSTYNDQGIRCKLTEKTKKRILNKNDLTMILNDKTATGRIIGRVLLIDNNDRYVFNQRTQRIEPYHDRYNATFLYQLLNASHIRDKIFKQSQGNTQIYVNWSTIQELDYFIPNIKEQVKLASLFSKIDNLIAFNERKCKKLKNIKRILLGKMFPENEDNVPKIRFKGFNNIWKKYKLEEITKITMGQSPNGTNYTQNPKDIILIQGNADLNDGVISPRIWTTQITKITEPNDIIFTVRAPVGEVARTYYYAVIGRGVASLKGNEFVYQILKKMNEFKHWSKLSAGSTFDSINSDELKNTIISMPTTNEQEKIGTFLKKIDNLITLQQRKCEKLRNIKETLLNKMLI